ncbi:hypothetical protein ABID95_001204 [Streptomyces atratus]
MRILNATNSRATPRPRSHTILTQVNPAPFSIAWPHCAWLVKRNLPAARAISQAYGARAASDTIGSGAPEFSWDVRFDHVMPWTETVGRESNESVLPR